MCRRKVKFGVGVRNAQVCILQGTVYDLVLTAAITQNKVAENIVCFRWGIISQNHIRIIGVGVRNAEVCISWGGHRLTTVFVLGVVLTRLKGAGTTFCYSKKLARLSSFRKREPLSTPPSGRKPEQVTTRRLGQELHGVLRALLLDKDWLELWIDGRLVRVNGLAEAVDDVIGPMVDRKLVVQNQRYGKHLKFCDIEREG